MQIERESGQQPLLSVQSEAMSNTIDSAKQMIHSRLAEIRDEEKRLEKALASLSPDGIRRRRTRSSSTAKKTQSPSRRRRRGGRADQVTKIVTKQPGLKASEIAKAAKIGSSQTRYRDPHRAHYLIAAELLTEFVAKGQRCVVVADDYDEKNGIVWHRDLLEAANSSDGPRVTAVVPTSSACSDLIQLCDLFSSAVARKLRKPEASVGGPRERYIAALEAGLGLNAGSILKGGNGLTVHEYHPTTR